jgi:hypothetical protein
LDLSDWAFLVCWPTKVAFFSLFNVGSGFHCLRSFPSSAEFLHFHRLFLILSELMDLFVAGRDQSAADQPNNLAEGHTPL